MAYHGGIQTNFQRAETASYFGREIGIMYTHAHIRYGEALARFGDAEGFFNALCRINPIAMRELVPSAALRQANCYYSSSDPAFADRYQALADYDKVSRGEIALEGGWRVYSSGSGIAVRLIMHCFLGLRVENEALEVDPCVPPELDGMSAIVNLTGRAIEVVYRTGKTGRGPVAVELNGTPLDFTRSGNRYRLAGVRIRMASWTGHLKEDGNRLIISLE
jgi:cellobiose phosphorylase